MKKLGMTMLSVLLLALALFGGAAVALEAEVQTEMQKEIRLPHVTGKLTVGQSVAVIVEKLGLNLDHLQFIKEPKASDHFTKVSDDAPYAQHFMVAFHNGLSLDKNIDPDARMTREHFSHLLFQAIMTKGDFAFIHLYIMINDEDQIHPDYMNSIQKLLISDIIKLDNKGNFNPKDSVSLGQAYFLLNAAAKFLKNVEPIDQPPTDHGEVTMSVSEVNEEINKVTVSWGEKPNPGYRIAIDRIDFIDNEAVIYYSLHHPDPEKFYIQVITEATATTYVSSDYQPTMKMSPNVTSIPSSNSSSSADRKSVV